MFKPAKNFTTNIQDTVYVSVVLPCRNELQGLQETIHQINESLSSAPFNFEIVVSDSSSDGSDEIARQMNCRVIKHNKLGYGTATRIGLSQARGEIIVMADADATYDFSRILEFITLLNNGYDLIIGNRFQGGIAKGAMPWMNRYIGNPVLTLFLKLLFRSSVKDSQSGLRAFRQEKFINLNLKSRGMEFASEMIVKSIAQGFQIAELPIQYRPRFGDSKLRPFYDGFRHIFYMISQFAIGSRW